jgi:tRNA threonylcarbamoyladenosine biosynthesis protein TsaE
MRELTFFSPRESFTFDLGRQLGQRLEQGDVLALWGELGAGRTFFARAIARGLGVPPQTPVTSPTFTLINEYEGRLHLYHIDLYRLSDMAELDTLPWRDVLFGTGVAVIEWPERLGRLLPDSRWDIRLVISGDECRNITIAAHGEHNCMRLETLGLTSDLP